MPTKGKICTVFKSLSKNERDYFFSEIFPFLPHKVLLAIYLYNFQQKSTPLGVRFIFFLYLFQNNSHRARLNNQLIPYHFTRHSILSITITQYSIVGGIGINGQYACFAYAAINQNFSVVYKIRLSSKILAISLAHSAQRFIMLYKLAVLSSPRIGSAIERVLEALNARFVSVIQARHAG